MKNVINSIGFTEEKKLKLAENLIGVGAVTASVGALIVGAGLVLIKGTQEWFVSTTNEQMDALANVYQKFNEIAVQ